MATNLTQQIRDMTAEGHSRQAILAKMLNVPGVNQNTVRSLVNRFGPNTSCHEKLEKAPTAVKAVPPSVSISLQFPDGSGTAEIKVRNRRGDILGTIILEAAGVRYRRPNQKGAADRIVSWNTLDKLMQLGLS